MELSKILVSVFALQFLSILSPMYARHENSNIFGEYIGASSRMSSLVMSLFTRLGGDGVGGSGAYFNPSSIDSWVSNLVSSLTDIIRQYNLDGIDIDYEHFQDDPDTFLDRIGRLITTTKKKGVISFASIAPYDDDEVQSHYKALWKIYGHLIDYVNFQFYAYDEGTTVSQFMDYFSTKKSNYEGGRILASFENGFFTARSKLKSKGELSGIFVWSADDSKSNGFKYEKQSQALPAIPH
ncbi:unnamed protein product [Withania somnifera]